MPAYLDVRPVGYNKGHIRIQIPTGNCLIMRGDIAHRGVEYMSGRGSQYPHYRLHVYFRPIWWNPLLQKDSIATIFAKPEFDDGIMLSSET